jgi:hypothetical protein
MVDLYDFGLDFVGAHWPFIAAVCVFWLVGHFMERSVFTKARMLRHAPNGGPRRFGQRFHHWVFFWGRESMELHPVATGAVLGLIWTNPEFADPPWPPVASAGYFAAAGFVSLFAWVIITRTLKLYGFDFSEALLPGESLRPADRLRRPPPQSSIPPKRDREATLPPPPKLPDDV